MSREQDLTSASIVVVGNPHLEGASIPLTSEMNSPQQSSSGVLPATSTPTPAPRTHTTNSSPNNRIFYLLHQTFRLLVHPFLDDTLKQSTKLLRFYQSTKKLDYLDNAIRTLQEAVGSPMNPRKQGLLWKNLGFGLSERYERLSHLDDLNAAIVAQRYAVDLLPSSGSDQIDTFSQFAKSLRRRYKLLGNFDDLEAAVTVLRRAIDIIKGDAQLFADLGLCLRSRFEALGDVEDLKTAITTVQRALQLTGDDRREKPRYFRELSFCLRCSYENLGEPNDLQNAIAASRRATELALILGIRRDDLLIDLSSLWHLRYERLDVLSDLRSCIDIRQQAIQLMNDSLKTKPQVLANLALHLRHLFERLGDLGDLDKAIAACQRAVELNQRTDYRDGASHLASLSSMLYLRFERLHNIEDLDRVVELCQAEVELLPDLEPTKPQRLSHLSLQLRRRFEHLGELEDLESAITASRATLQLVRDSLHRESPYIGDFRDLLDLRSQRLQALSNVELNETIARYRHSVLLPDDIPHVNAEEQLSNLSLYHYHRFKRLGDFKDLESAISTLEIATAVGHDMRLVTSERMITLGRYLLDRFERSVDLADLESVISHTRLALETICDQHPAQQIGLTTLGIALQSRFDRLGHTDDVENAILTRRRIVELTPDTHLDMTGVLDELSCSLMSRFMHERTFRNYEETRLCSETAISRPLGKPSTRLRAAMRYLQFLSDSPGFSSAELLLKAHAHIIETLPEIAWLGYDIQRRFEETSRLGELVNKAVCAAIASGALRQAVEWLEAGRTLIWAQILFLRTPLDDIGDHHPDLARSLFDIQSELQRSGSTVTDRHLEIVAAYESLMNQIRHCTGCKNFLRPRKLAGLISSPGFGFFTGTLVLINVAESSCDALLLSSTGNIRSVHLPDLTQPRAQKMHDLWTRHVELCGLRRRGSAQHRSTTVHASSTIFAQVLKHLWLRVVHPILKALDFSRKPTADHLPHIVWCPTGPLMQLPLHAAGVYDDDQPGPRVFDFVLSSYTPSLSALLRCCDGVVKEYPAPNVLVVTQPDTPGRSPLPGTQNESTILRAILPENKQTVLEHEQATVDSTLAVVSRHPWIHLACHGSQNSEDPAQSAFALYDGPLTLNTLMDTVVDNAELAFLSACQTATGDEKIPEESAHLAAGMLAVGFKGVIATMWSIRDEDAPIVVEEYYRKLLEYRNTGSVQRGQTGAAYALHEATRRLREEVGERSFEKWVPFVHYGV
ncbi:hypothetical protein PENSPDRAFT_609979 [Peniophora sp. CONT]|nr:hypothetical protein PENSPDRAFT_609979 [Peniophora sp. CONT]